jgi:hypothetical protein
VYQFISQNFLLFYNDWLFQLYPKQLSGLADGQSCQAIHSFLRGVYINVGEILFNSDWLKSYIYFPYMPTQLISKNVKKQEILWKEKTYTCLLSKFLKYSSAWSIVPVLNKYNYISSLKMLFLEKLLGNFWIQQTGCLFSVLFPRFKLQSYLLFLQELSFLLAGTYIK